MRFAGLLSMLNIVRTMRDKHGVSSEVPCFPPQGPHPLEDNFGVFASCVMLEQMTATAVQFGTIRKTRSALSNHGATIRAELTESVLVGGKNKGERWNFSATPMHGLWFNRCKDGCHSRMGGDIRPDKAMSIELMLEMQKLHEIKLFHCTSHKDVLEVCLNTVFYILSFVGGFRGEEMPMLSLDAIGKHLAHGQPRTQSWRML
jgi:hypothetical protein